MPPISQPDDIFTLLPELIFEQATASSKILLTIPCPISDDGKREAYFLLFTRRAWLPAKEGFIPDLPNGMSLMVEIVAYECDEDGQVLNWERRYEGGGMDVTAATHALCLALCNGVAILRCYDGILGKVEREYNAMSAQMWAEWDADLGELSRLGST